MSASPSTGPVAVEGPPRDGAPTAHSAETPSAEEAGLVELAEQYDLLEEVGRGGSAVVYRARDRRLRRDVALKAVRLAPALSAQERALEVARLAREARTTAQLSHPNIVTVYAVHELRDGLAVAMQYVPGQSLKQLLAHEGAMAPGRAMRVLCEVAGALAYAHAHGVVHRDVKPENIFIDGASGRALLADFGAARAGEADVRVTRTGATVGTPAYMAPEQIDGGPLDGRADLYSLGLVAWEALVGRRPWEGAGLYQLLHHQLHDTLPPIAAVRARALPPVPLAMEYVVARCLEKRPAARWASADVVAAQLERPVLPADYKLWEREHRRRVTAYAAPDAVSRAPRVPADAQTERFAPGLEPSTQAPLSRAVAGPAGSAGDAEPLERAGPGEAAPSWARPRTGPSRRMWAGAVAAAVAVVALAAGVPTAARVQRSPGGLAGPDLPPGRARYDATGRASGARPVPPAAGDTPTGATLGSVGERETSPAGAGPRSADSVGRGAALNGDAKVPSVGDTSRRVSVGIVAPPTPQRALSPGTRTPEPRSVSERGLPTPSTAGGEVEPAAPVALPAPPRIGIVATAVGREGRGRRVVTGPERTTIAAGARHTCALDGAGQARCWGANESGQLGAGDLAPRDAPAPVEGELRFTHLATGGAHSCGLTADGDAYCWGDDDHGQLGDATSSLRDAPVRVAGSGRYQLLRAGLDHTCALSTAEAVACWGANRYGQLGDASARDRATPALVPGLRAAALAAGWNHTCALTPEGAAFCWGDNGSGQLGDGGRAPRATPVAVAGGRRFVAIAAGARHTCAVAADDGVPYCWGSGAAGGAGAHLTPTAVESPAPFVTLAAGSVHTCGRTAAGQVYCWGRNTYGQLGDGSTADRWRPARVPGGPYSALSAAGAHTCAVAGGAPVCWGYNVSGQLGDGTRAHHAAPVRVGRAGS